MAYSTGTITLTNGTTNVTGSSTTFNTSGAVKPGFVLFVNGQAYPIASVQSDTQLTLRNNFVGSTGSTADFSIEKTSGGDVAVSQNLATLISDYTTVKNEAGEGKFADGTLAAPGMRFTQDEDNGFYRTGTNAWAGVVGGVARLAFSTSGIAITGALTGTAVMQSSADETAGRLMTTGAFGIGGALVEFTDDLDDPDRPGGRYVANSPGSGTFPPGKTFGIVDQFRRFAGTGTGHRAQMFYHLGDIYHRYGSGTSGWQSWQTILSERDGSVAINGAHIWAEVITIGDDVAVTLDPPETSGFAAVRVDGFAGYSGIAFFDITASPNAEKSSAGGASFAVAGAAVPTGTTGTDGNMTLYHSDGALTLENRSGASRTVQITYF